MRLIICAVSLLLLCGCFGNAPTKKQTPLEFQITGKVIDFSKLEKGGKVAFVPFKPGPLGEAGETLDRISLMLIKGIQEELMAQRCPLEVTDEVDQADFIIEGYVEEFTIPSTFSRMVMRKKKARLSVSGEVYSKETGLKTMTFASSRMMKAVKDDPLDAAYGMGKAIGEYLVKLLEKEIS